jgi:hypothetical protein
MDKQKMRPAGWGVVIVSSGFMGVSTTSMCSVGMYSGGGVKGRREHWRRCPIEVALADLPFIGDLGGKTGECHQLSDYNGVFLLCIIDDSDKGVQLI